MLYLDGFTYGPQAEDWTFFWDPFVEDFVEDFWMLVENPPEPPHATSPLIMSPRSMPGLWVN